MSPFLAWTKTEGNLGAEDPTTHDEVRSKGLCQLLKGINRIWPKADKPPHGHRSQAEREYFAHQSLIFGMDGHPLVKLAYMLYGVHSTVVHSESRLMELPRELYPLYLACEGRLRDSV